MTNYYAAENALDIAPMIDALKFQPSDFELKKGWLVHVPSRHRYRFDRRGQLTIDAHCGCVLLAARREQEPELLSAFHRWREDYWRAIEINREFADHFAPVGRVRRFARDLHMAWRRLWRAPGAADSALPGRAVFTPAE